MPSFLKSFKSKMGGAKHHEDGTSTASEAHETTETPKESTAAAAEPSSTTATTTATPPSSASAPFLAAVKARRTYYPLTKTLPPHLTPAAVEAIVTEAITHVPSSFNSQSNRAVVLFGAEHDKLWADITTGALRAVVTDDEQWAATEGKMKMFGGAAGTVLFFEDQTVVQGMQAKFAAYADKFPVWATQSDAMLQFVIWTALEAEGLGVNLQHYNPLIDEKVAETWKIPADWKLNAQLVFGGKTGDAGSKDFKPTEEILKVFGKDE